MSDEATEPTELTYESESSVGRVAVYDIAGMLATCDDLAALWTALHRDQSGETRDDTHHKSVPVIVHGLTAHVADLALTVATLYRAQRSAVAIPLIRCMVEDVVMIQHVISEQDGWMDVQNASFKNNRMIRQDFEATGTSLPWFPEADQHLEWLRENGARNPRPLKELFPEAAPGTLSVYTRYRLLSDAMHAGIGVVNMYLDFDESVPGSFGLALEGRNAHTAQNLVTTVEMLHTAVSSWNVVLGSDNADARLLEIKERSIVRFIER